MPQSFFLVQLGGVKGPMTFSKVLDGYFDGQIHDVTPVWDSAHRRWHPFAELRAPLVMTFQPETVVAELEVGWVGEATEQESSAEGSAGFPRGGSRRLWRFARTTTRWWFGVAHCV